MALTDEQLARVSAAVVKIYEDAERHTVSRIAAALAQDADAPVWRELKLLQVLQVLAEVRADYRRVADAVGREALAAITSAYMQGGGRSVLSAQAVALANELVGTLTGTHPAILRAVDDVWRRTVAEASGVQFTGAASRREAASRALGRLAARGLTAYIDRAGRRWQTQTFVEMAMRSASHRASEVGLTDRLRESGRDLVIVSDHAGECPDCRPFEGKVLSLTGAPAPAGVPVLCTLAEAQARGYGHPNCRHRLVAYQPGITETPQKLGRPDDYEHRQEQRRLERGVREWRAREAAAMDDATRAEARAKARAWTARLRDLEAEHGLKRSRRTSPTAAR